MKAQKKVEKNGLNGKKGSTKLLAGPFPVVELIGEPVRKSDPEELVALGKAARKQEKRKWKAQKKAEKNKLKEKKSSTKMMASTFPMIELIDEQVRTSIPEELVAKVKEAKKKKDIISSNYPYPKQMKNSEYLEEIELLQIRTGQDAGLG